MATVDALAHNFIRQTRAATASPYVPVAQEDSLHKMQLRVHNTASVDAATLTSCLIQIGHMNEIEATHHTNGLFAIHDQPTTAFVSWKQFTDAWIRIQLYHALRAIRDAASPAPSNAVPRSLVLQSIANQLGSQLASELTDKLFTEKDPKRTSLLPLLDIARWYYTHYGPSAKWTPVPPTVLRSPSVGDSKEGGDDTAAGEPITESVQGKWRNPKTFCGLVFVDDELFIGDMPSGGFAGEYGADVYTGAMHLTVSQHRPIHDKLSDDDNKWMASLAHVTNFTCTTNDNGSRILVLQYDNDLPPYELAEEADTNGDDGADGTAAAATDDEPAATAQSATAAKKKAKKPSAIAEEGEGDGFEF